MWILQAVDSNNLVPYYKFVTTTGLFSFVVIDFIQNVQTQLHTVTRCTQKFSRELSDFS